MTRFLLLKPLPIPPLLPLIFCASIAATVSGCATTTVGIVAPVCKAIKTVTISKDDKLTDGTATQILSNNAARGKLCKG